MTTFNFTRKLVSAAAIASLAIGVAGALGPMGTASAADSFRAPGEGTVAATWGPGELHEYTIQKTAARVMEISGLKMEADQIELADEHETEYQIIAAK